MTTEAGQEKAGWPDGSKGVKALYFCPVCGEEAPDDPVARSISDIDHPRNESGELVCEECQVEREVAVAYQAFPVLPQGAVTALVEKADDLLEALVGIERSGEAGAMEEFEEAQHELAAALSFYKQEVE